MKNPLGEPTTYSTVFNPEVLFPIARAQARVEIGVREPLPFEGCDRWNCYEVSWLDEASGIPQVGIATIEYPASSAYLIESKSLKLFLVSLNFTHYSSKGAVAEAIRAELARVLECEAVTVRIVTPDQWQTLALVPPPGESVDAERPEPTTSARLKHEEGLEGEVEELLHSNLLRSLCPVTAQPDWGTLVVFYRGKKLHRQSLMNYLVAHRSYQGFHEQCCERIFADLQQALSPSALWVGCFYTRRGGIDINPQRWLPGTNRVNVAGRLARQ